MFIFLTILITLLYAKRSTIITMDNEKGQSTPIFTESHQQALLTEFDKFLETVKMHLGLGTHSGQTELYQKLDKMVKSKSNENKAYFKIAIRNFGLGYLSNVEDFTKQIKTQISHPSAQIINAFSEKVTKTIELLDAKIENNLNQDLVKAVSSLVRFYYNNIANIKLGLRDYEADNISFKPAVDAYN